jgi:hypothetical protein
MGDDPTGLIGGEAVTYPFQNFDQLEIDTTGTSQYSTNVIRNTSLGEASAWDTGRCPEMSRDTKG